MSKVNPFANLMSDDPEKKAIKTPEKPTRKPEPAAEIKRGRGRPAGPPRDTQATTLRLHPDDHHALKTLAMRDRVQLNDIIYQAVADHCKKRGVTLQHAPKLAIK